MTDEKNKAALAAKKALGTLNKVLTMIEQDVYCPEVIQQINAINGLLDSAKKALLTGHLHHCLEENLKQDKAKAIGELTRILELKA